MISWIFGFCGVCGLGLVFLGDAGLVWGLACACVFPVGVCIYLWCFVVVWFGCWYCLGWLGFGLLFVCRLGLITTLLLCGNFAGLASC